MKPATYSRYEGSFRLHIGPELGDLHFDEITRDRAKRFVIALMRKIPTGATDTTRRLAKDSIRNAVATFRIILNEAIERKHIETNPAIRLGKLDRTALKKREEVDVFTAEEIPLLLDATQKHFG